MNFRLPILVEISSGAFGHQILDYEQIQFNIEIHSDQVYPLYFISKDSANSALADYMKATHFVLPNFPFSQIKRLFCRLSVKYRSLSQVIHRSDCYFLPKIHSRKPSLIASKMLIDFDNFNFIKETSLNEKLPIGIVVREGLYDIEKAGIDLYKSNMHRNSEIETFLPALKKLSTLDYLPIRFGQGSKAKEPESSFFYGIEDFAGPQNPELRQFYIASRCSFFISTGSGPDCLAMFFRKPLYMVNTVFPTIPQTEVVKKFFLKKYYWLRPNGKKELLSFPELENLHNDILGLKGELRDGRLHVESRSPKEIDQFVQKHILGLPSKKFDTFNEYRDGIFY